MSFTTSSAKALPDKAKVTIAIEGERATVRSGESRFTLATLPASDFLLSPNRTRMTPTRGVTPDVAATALNQIFA
jgi:DNA polymerase III sliding clamp (beta) subunit (PCNA family)